MTIRTMDQQYFCEVALIWIAYFGKRITMAQRDCLLTSYRAGASQLDDLA